MAGARTLVCDDVETAVDEILNRLGKTVALGVPLGLGKPVELVNALYRRAAADPTLRLRILTALSLEKPSGGSALESAFLKPFVERVFGDCPDLEYLAALRSHTVPPNVGISEFYFKPGSFLDNPHAQQQYISSNYSHAARDVCAQGCNVVAQMVARRVVDGEARYSLSCNPDTGPELRERLLASGRAHVVVALVNDNLPFMAHDAEVGADYFDIVVDHPRYTTTLFSTPKTSVVTADYLIGLRASTLIKDGGTLQVGIGALGDAIVYGARLRHEHNDAYREILRDCGILPGCEGVIHETGGTGPFARGLYAASEMFVDGFMHLYRSGILKRRVYDFWALQQLINEDRCDPERLTPEVLSGLADLGVRVIRTRDFEVLQHHGLFNDATRYDDGYLVAPDGQRVIANVADPRSRAVMARCLGPKLRNGILLHGGFFLGPNEFYRWLRELPEEERRQICMTGVYKVNQLDHNPRLYKAQRIHGRFINTGMMATLAGAIVSDGLADGRVVSGVGGQYNFVAMAHQLPTGRSILLIRAVREPGDGTASSNIVFNYGHVTIPRHLRDFVVTEYGIASLRSKTDSEVVQELLNVADSRFQAELLAQAKRAGKLPTDYEIPEAHRHNTPERLEAMLAPHRKKGLFPAFPLGHEFTEQELALGKALRGLKARAARGKLRMLWDSLSVRDIPAAARPYLERMQLDAPADFQSRIAQKLLVRELKDSGALG